MLCDLWISSSRKEETMKITDFKGLFKKSVATVESVENPFEDYYVIKLNPALGVTWNPGEHGIFKLSDKSIKGKKWRGFSVASIQEEGFMLLGIRTGKEVSSYKKHLIEYKKGDKVSLTGPFGWFKIQDETSALVLFASGVGVTPIRALIKSLEHNENRPIEVVYASNKFYLFGDEMDQIAEKNPKIILHKTVNTEETQMKLDELSTKYDNNAYYYISGSPSVLKSVKKKLKSKGIKNNRIINDSFIGY